MQAPGPVVDPVLLFEGDNLGLEVVDVAPQAEDVAAPAVRLEAALDGLRFEGLCGLVLELAGLGAVGVGGGPPAQAPVPRVLVQHAAVAGARGDAVADDVVRTAGAGLLSGLRIEWLYPSLYSEKLEGVNLNQM